jgi:hypothetical protein
MTDLAIVKAQIIAKRDEIIQLQETGEELEVVEFPKTSGYDLISIETNKAERLAMIEFANFVICLLVDCVETVKGDKE